MAEAEKSESPRARRRSVVGIVTGAKMNKTRRVDVPRLTRHAKYGKFIRRKTVCYVHDEKNESVEGDRVEIMECRPMSKLKRWRLVRVISHDAAIPKGDLIQESLDAPKGE
jgi:small subunit ribosomal protein S17